MKQAKNECEDGQVADIPVSAVLGRPRANRYGSVPGLDDEELADPDELERQVYAEELGQVLLLPASGQRSGFRRELDENGFEWGAFGTVDFERSVPERDKLGSRVAWLRQKLRDVVLMTSMLRERLPRKASSMVLKYLRMRILKLEHIASDDMRALGRWHLRAMAIQEEIAELQKRRKARQAQALAKWLDG